MPYRVDVTNAPADAFDRLVALGALDIELLNETIAALMPDAVPAERVEQALGVASVRISAALGRDDDSVWILTPRPVTAGGVSIVPATAPAATGAIRLTDSAAFGTGLHPTTALCLEAIRDAVDLLHPDSVLDIGTGSGVLALAALTLGVPRAVAVDIDAAALAVAAENARINQLTERLHLIRGGPEAVRGRWPLVVANVVAAPLIEMAPVIVQRVAHGGRLILSGIPAGVTPDVERVYVRLGMRRGIATTRAGWAAVILDPSW